MNFSVWVTNSCVCVCLSAFTVELYQQHQEQLALMHKRQLEQIQLQQQANIAASANSSHVSVPRSGQIVRHKTERGPVPFSYITDSNWILAHQSLGNTLDQASAQFAASALVTADLLALKTKEELSPGGGVNGVLSPSGTVIFQLRPFVLIICFCVLV